MEKRGEHQNGSRYVTMVDDLTSLAVARSACQTGLGQRAFALGFCCFLPQRCARRQRATAWLSYGPRQCSEGCPPYATGCRQSTSSRPPRPQLLARNNSGAVCRRRPVDPRWITSAGNRAPNPAIPPNLMRPTFPEIERPRSAAPRRAGADRRARRPPRFEASRCRPSTAPDARALRPSRRRVLQSAPRIRRGSSYICATLRVGQSAWSGSHGSPVVNRRWRPSHGIGVRTGRGRGRCRACAARAGPVPGRSGSRRRPCRARRRNRASACHAASAAASPRRVPAPRRAGGDPRLVMAAEHPVGPAARRKRGLVVGDRLGAGASHGARPAGN